MNGSTEFAVATSSGGGLTALVRARGSDGVLIAGILISILLWGGNNVATRFLVQHWPPAWVVCTRFYASGLILLLCARSSRATPARLLSVPLGDRDLWLKVSFHFFLYILALIWAFKLTAASNVALYFAAAPIWALIWEAREMSRAQLGRTLGAAGLTLLGVGLLFGQAFHLERGEWLGHVLGLLSGFLWTHYCRLCRELRRDLSGAQLTGECFWRTAVWLTPLALRDAVFSSIPLRWDLMATQSFAIVGPGVIAFVLWMRALNQWQTSRLMLFGNLVPLVTAVLAWLCIDEAVPSMFWPAMLLICFGVVVGQRQP